MESYLLAELNIDGSLSIGQLQTVKVITFKVRLK